MARSRFKLRPKRRLAFNDRKLILTEIGQLVRSATQAGGIFRVCSLVGIGGAGKTRLIDRICEVVKDNDALPIRTSLESEASGTAAAPLKAIRDQAPFECLLFDTALAVIFRHLAKSMPWQVSQVCLRTLRFKRLKQDPEPLAWSLFL